MNGHVSGCLLWHLVPPDASVERGKEPSIIIVTGLGSSFNSSTYLAQARETLGTQNVFIVIMCVTSEPTTDVIHPLAPFAYAVLASGPPLCEVPLCLSSGH